jgi:hypothetical protein
MDGGNGLSNMNHDMPGIRHHRPAEMNGYDDLVLDMGYDNDNDNDNGADEDGTSPHNAGGKTGHEQVKAQQRQHHLHRHFMNGGEGGGGGGTSNIRDEGEGDEEYDDNDEEEEDVEEEDVGPDPVLSYCDFPMHHEADGFNDILDYSYGRDH